MDEAFAELESKDTEIENLKVLNADLTMQLQEANNVLEGQEKGRLINEILPKSQYKIADLAGKSIDALKDIKATLDQAMPPHANSVRFGVKSGDLSDRERGLTVGDMFVGNAKNKKEAA
jgi:hypothetical protein